MGLLGVVSREIKHLIVGVWRTVFPVKEEREPMRVPRSWKRKTKSLPAGKKSKDVVVQPDYKIRIPGLRSVNRGLAAICLLVNGVFSQYVLGSVGQGAQPLFIVFLLSSYVSARYLWVTRGKEA